jgi:sporulation protein YlmC with PRC-barrel domain
MLFPSKSKGGHPMKKLMLTTAMSALLIGAAMAQGMPPANPSTTPSAANPAPGVTGPSTSTSNASAPQTVASQKPDQWLASKFQGTDVLGTDDKKIGDVSDILFDKEGKIDAYVISVGGFLGVGSKEVALAPSSFTVVKDSNGGYDKLKLSMSVDELKSASNFERYSPPRATTGQGSPAGTPSRPTTPAPAPAK